MYICEQPCMLIHSSLNPSINPQLNPFLTWNMPSWCCNTCTFNNGIMIGHTFKADMIMLCGELLYFLKRCFISYGLKHFHNLNIEIVLTS